jgi:hypothetical protein
LKRAVDGLRNLPDTRVAGRDGLSRIHSRARGRGVTTRGLGERKTETRLEAVVTTAHGEAIEAHRTTSLAAAAGGHGGGSERIGWGVGFTQRREASECLAVTAGPG